MYCNGLLRIAEIRDIYGPVQFVCRKIPKPIFEHLYGISLPQPKEGEDPQRPPTAQELLDRHAYIRGYMNRHGQPDHQRSGRVLLNDFVAGKLLYASPPPSVSESTFNPLNERLKIKGIQILEMQSEESQENEHAQKEPDFQIGFDPLTGVVPTEENEDAFMNRIKPHGKKTVRREKEKDRLESQSGAFTTGQRPKYTKGTKKSRPPPTSVFPTAVKVSSTKGQSVVTVLGSSNTLGTAPVTH